MYLIPLALLLDKILPVKMKYTKKKLDGKEEGLCKTFLLTSSFCIVVQIIDVCKGRGEERDT